jgi:hypothetical protein
VGESVCCILVLDSVTSTLQWIRQPEARLCYVLSEPERVNHGSRTPTTYVLYTFMMIDYVSHTT